MLVVGTEAIDDAVYLLVSIEEVAEYSKVRKIKTLP